MSLWQFFSVINKPDELCLRSLIGCNIGCSRLGIGGAGVSKNWHCTNRNWLCANRTCSGPDWKKCLHYAELFGGGDARKFRRKGLCAEIFSDHASCAEILPIYAETPIYAEISPITPICPFTICPFTPKCSEIFSANRRFTPKYAENFRRNRPTTLEFSTKPCIFPVGVQDRFCQ